MWRVSKTDIGSDLVWDGVETGIAPSPTKGTANIQNANIATEMGEIMASYARVKQNQAAITNGTLTASVSDGAVLLDAPSTLLAGQWITVSASTIGSATSSASYLAVGGGGGSGGPTANEAAGGGGAGGMVTGSFTPSVAAYTIAVGAGGAGGATGVTGSSGGLSSITRGTVSFDYLVIGGGGGGAGSPSVGGGGDLKGGGGGGAGRFRTGSTTASGGTHTITVGGGGAGGTGDNNGATGSTSSALSIESVGGGGGGKQGTNGLSGASGGGGGSPTATGGAATNGFAGGNGAEGGGADESAGGGGGSSAVGGNGTGTNGGVGGAGTSSSITGSAVTYAGGGGGGAGVGGVGGSGGGGAGSGNTNGVAGTANRGSGGGGSGTNGGFGPFNGGNGGSGVVILRFVTASIAYTHTGGSVATSGSDTIITWNASGTFTFATVNLGIGGGGGAAPATTAGSGGSGGGGGSDGGAAGTGYSGQGSNGGAGNGSGDESGGGGGGKGGAGTAATDGVGGNGGAGTASSISGTSVTYAGGGGGGTTGATSGTGGAGGGGDGVAGDPTTFPQCKGDDGFGGGAGGGSNGAYSGADGGSGVVIISYVTGTMSATGGAISFSGGNTIHTFLTSGTFTVVSITTGTYFVSYKNSSNKVKLSAVFDPYGLYPIAHGTSGTATFSTLTTTNSPIAKATEKYGTATDTHHRYYMLDVNGYVWVYDTLVYATTLAANGIGEMWMLPDPTDYSSYDFTGMAILNGWLIVLNNAKMYAKPTIKLGATFTVISYDGDERLLLNPFPTHTNFAFTGGQGRMYYCDGNYLGEIFPTTSLATGLANIQSYCSWTGSGTTGTVTAVISSGTPNAFGTDGAPDRIPAVFFPAEGSALPAGLTEGTVYWVVASTTDGKQFTVYEAASGGLSISITTSDTGLYFNTFYPLGEQHDTADDVVVLFTFSPQRLNFPAYESLQCMVEIGNSILIGGITNTIYPWNQIDATPSDLIALPEANVKAMVNANNMAYIFAGNKGNIYISNNSSASLVTKVPDYCAGVPGTPLTYIEPRFTWGDAMYLRGRVYFSILDQNSTKAGNCGGVWSFYPTQNFSYGQDTGLALRLENQQSYADYDGVATVLLPAQDQNAISPQYWAGWQDSYSVGTSTFGIDGTNTVPVTTYAFETDLAPTGTILNKDTFQQVEYKLTTPLVSTDAVQLYYRLNSTSAWTSLGSVVEETADRLSGYFTPNFEKTQWVQFRAVITTTGATNSSFVRLKELLLR